MEYSLFGGKYVARFFFGNSGIISNKTPTLLKTKIIIVVIGFCIL